MLMRRYEHWAHRLFPKYPLHTVTEIVETSLASKRDVRVRHLLVMFWWCVVCNIEQVVLADELLQKLFILHSSVSVGLRLSGIDALTCHCLDLAICLFLVLFLCSLGLSGSVTARWRWGWQWWQCECRHSGTWACCATSSNDNVGGVEVVSCVSRILTWWGRHTMWPSTLDKSLNLWDSRTRSRCEELPDG